jgi:hypothetical protein
VKAESGSVWLYFALWRLRSGPPISVVGWVKEGGSLAGNESSSSRLRSFSCSLCVSFFVFAALSLVVDLLVSAMLVSNWHLIVSWRNGDPARVIQAPVGEFNSRRLRRPRRAGIRRRDHLGQLAILFVVETGQELGDRTRLTLGCRPVDLAWRLAVIAAGISFHAPEEFAHRRRGGVAPNPEVARFIISPCRQWRAASPIRWLSARAVLRLIARSYVVGRT